MTFLIETRESRASLSDQRLRANAPYILGPSEKTASLVTALAPSFSCILITGYATEQARACEKRRRVVLVVILEIRRYIIHDAANKAQSFLSRRSDKQRLKLAQQTLQAHSALEHYKH